MAIRAPDGANKPGKHWCMKNTFPVSKVQNKSFTVSKVQNKPFAVFKVQKRLCCIKPGRYRCIKNTFVVSNPIPELPPLLHSLLQILHNWTGTTTTTTEWNKMKNVRAQQQHWNYLIHLRAATTTIRSRTNQHYYTFKQTEWKPQHSIHRQRSAATATTTTFEKNIAI